MANRSTRTVYIYAAKPKVNAGSTLTTISGIGKVYQSALQEGGIPTVESLVERYCECKTLRSFNNFLMVSSFYKNNPHR